MKCINPNLYNNLKKVGENIINDYSRDSESDNNNSESSYEMAELRKNIKTAVEKVIIKRPSRILSQGNI